MNFLKSIAANVKQVLMIAISTIVFETPITVMNGIGIIVVLIGSARYSYVSVLERQSAQLKAKRDDSESDINAQTEDDNETKPGDIEDAAVESTCKETVELISSKEGTAVRKR